MIADILKHQTKELHDRVELKFNSSKIFQDDYTPDDYRKLLTFNYIFLKTFEQPVFRLLSEKYGDMLMLRHRRKLHLFDLEREDVISSGYDIHEIAVNCEAEALGILYVMEGSTLGGTMIAKKLEGNPHFSGKTFPYFRCYGERTGSMWKNFRFVLNDVVREEEHDQVLIGAEKAYHFLLGLPD